jgi:hypothetical protein
VVRRNRALLQNFLVISVIIIVIVILMMGMGHRRPRGGSQVDDVLYGSSTVSSPRSSYAGVLSGLYMFNTGGIGTIFGIFTNTAIGRATAPRLKTVRR